MKIEKKEAKVNEITFAAVYQDYYEVQKRKVRITTLKKIENLYKYLDSIKNESISNLTIARYRKFYDGIDKKNLSLNYKNKIIRLLNTLNKYAFKFYNVSTSIIDRVGLFNDPNEFKKEMNFLHTKNLIVSLMKLITKYTKVSFHCYIIVD